MMFKIAHLSAMNDSDHSLRDGAGVRLLAKFLAL
jgi:hypothetical protein